MSPTAENTTVKTITQKIKVSPSHRDLIRQITNWQIAILADRLINAQNKVSFFLSDSTQAAGGHQTAQGPGSPEQCSGHQQVRD